MTLKEKITQKIYVICGWCKNPLEANITKDKNDNARSILICPGCSRTLPSSRRESTHNIVGRKHIHRDWKSGDIV